MTIELGDCLEAEFEIKLCETCNLCAEQLAVATKRTPSKVRARGSPWGLNYRAASGCRGIGNAAWITLT